MQLDMLYREIEALGGSPIMDAYDEGYTDGLNDALAVLRKFGFGVDMAPAQRNGEAWREMSDAPKDGTQILVARDNGCGFDYYTVWWCPIEKHYPWRADHNAYPVDRFDYWSHIATPEE